MKFNSMPPKLLLFCFLTLASTMVLAMESEPTSKPYTATLTSTSTTNLPTEAILSCNTQAPILSLEHSEATHLIDQLLILHENTFKDNSEILNHTLNQIIYAHQNSLPLVNVLHILNHQPIPSRVKEALIKLPIISEFTIPKQYKGPIKNIIFSPDMHRFALQGNNQILVHDLTTNQKSSPGSVTNSNVHSIRFSSCGNFLAVILEDISTRQWNLQTNKETTFTKDKFPIPNDKPQTIDHNISDILTIIAEAEIKAIPKKIQFYTSPDNTTIAINTPENNIEVIDIKTKQVLFTSTKYCKIEYSPDSKFLASWSSPSSVQIWDLKMRREPFPLITTMNNVENIHFSPNGKFLATWSGAKLFQLWDLEAQRKPLPLIITMNNVEKINFSPDEKLLITHALNFETTGTIKIIRLKSDLLVDQRLFFILFQRHIQEHNRVPRLCPTLTTIFNSLPTEYKNLLWHEINYDGLQYTSPTDDLVSKKRKQPDVKT